MRISDWSSDVCSSDLYACGDVDSSVLFQDRLFVAVPGNHADGLGASIPAEAIEPDRLLMLEDGHCLKDHALSACNRPELRAEAQMLGTSLHTLVQLVDNDLGVTLLQERAIDAGLLQGPRGVRSEEHPCGTKSSKLT